MSFTKLLLTYPENLKKNVMEKSGLEKSETSLTGNPGQGCSPVNPFPKR